MFGRSPQFDVSDPSNKPSHYKLNADRSTTHAYGPLRRAPVVCFLGYLCHRSNSRIGLRPAVGQLLLPLHSPVQAIERRSGCSKSAQRGHCSARRGLFDQTRRLATTFMVAASARAQRATFEIVSIVPSISRAWAIVPTTMITARNV